MADDNEMVDGVEAADIAANSTNYAIAKSSTILRVLVP
jgi:hypothetical protein